MKTLLFLCVLLGLSAAIVVKASSRILGGTPAQAQQYPFVVSLRSQNEHFCGGFIYNNRWIVTTATCVRNRTIGEFAAHMGTISRTEIGITQAIERIVIHPDYHEFLVLNNIAMIRTAGVMTLAGAAQAISIAITETPGETIATVTGWGRTERAGDYSEILQGLSVTTMTRDQCLAEVSILNRRYIYESTICSTSPVGQGICAGDGGGVLFIGDGVTRQAIGIASWSMPCGTGAPDVYVRLMDYITWINMNGLQ